jgi:hypothetical protein
MWRSMVGASALAALVLAGASCNGGTHYTVNEAIYLHSGADSVTFRGGGCSFIQLPGSGGASDGPHPGDFAVTEGPDGDAYLVRVFSDDSLLTERRFDEAQLSSGDVYEVNVTTHSGDVYTLKYWGGGCGVGADGAVE